MSPLTAHAVFFAVLFLPAMYAAWSDLRDMRIPNGLVLLCVLLYLVTGPMVLSMGEFLWRFVPALVVLVVGFLVTLTRQFGAGDVKYATALVLFVAFDDLPIYMVIYSVTSLVALIVIKLMKYALPTLAFTDGWRSLSSERIPLATALSVATLFYLAVAIRTYLTL